MTMTEKILSNHIDSDASSSTSSAARSVRPGDNVWTKVDKLMTHDVCGPGTFGIFQKEFGESARVWDAEAVIIIPVRRFSSLVLFSCFERARGGEEQGRRKRKEKKKKAHFREGSSLHLFINEHEKQQDHYIFTSDARANRNVDILRDMAKQYDIKYFYDIQDRSDFKANPDYKGRERKRGERERKREREREESSKKKGLTSLIEPLSILPPRKKKQASATSPWRRRDIVSPGRSCWGRTR